VSAVRQLTGLVVFVAICFAVAGIATAFTTPAIPSWYAGLRKPSWTPPNWVFGPVWSFLYLAMAVAAWLVWRELGLSGGAVPLTIFGIQLALNLAWCVIFFSLHLPGPAFVEIVVLLLAIAATIAAFWQVSAAAGVLLLPYIAWVGYAAALNFGVWRMNA